MTTYLYSLLFLTLFATCDRFPQKTVDNFKGYTINGTAANAPEKTPFYLLAIDGSNSTPVDTAYTDAKGNFTLRGISEQIQLGLIRSTNNQQILLVLENKKMTLQFDYTTWKGYSLKGTKASEQMTQMVNEVVKLSPAEQFAYLKTWADTCSNAVVSYVAVTNLPIDQHYSSYEKVLLRLEAQMPNTRALSEFKAGMESAKNLTRTNIGGEAPDLAFESPEGVVYKLSDLRGKTVLLDFWASWCGPCRRENPTVVAAYNKYKDKGFTVYSVSLDSNKDAWKTAIAKDQLAWEYHVSDLGGWKSKPALIYGVGSIPQSYLIDSKGIIIAKNLRGEILESKLTQIFGQ